ncbi:Tnks2 [Symbiodinium sp. CCMP2592]|nr:Tnks2 [Symbiodinium sp. CCMP2592]
MGRIMPLERLPSRSNRTPLPRRLPQARTVARRHPRPHGRSRGRSCTMGIEHRQSSQRDPTRSRNPRKRARRSSSRPKPHEQTPKREEPRAHQERRSDVTQDGESILQRRPAGCFKDSQKYSMPAFQDEEEETQEEEQEEGQKEQQQQQQHEHWKREQLKQRFNRLTRQRAPISRRAQSAPSGPQVPRSTNPASPGRDEPNFGTVWCRGRSQDFATVPEIHPSAHFGVGGECRPEARAIDFGHRRGQADCQRHLGGIGCCDSEGQSHRTRSGRRNMAGGSKFGAYSHGSRKIGRSGRSTGGNERIPEREQGQTGHGERQRLGGARRQRQVEREGEERRWKERGREVGTSIGPESRADEALPLNGGQAGAQCGASLPCHMSPLAGASTGIPQETLPPPRQDSCASVSDVHMPCKSGDLGELLLAFILGSDDCGFSELVASSCGAEEETTAEGTLRRKRDVFPLPLPRKSEIARFRLERSNHKVWLYVVVSALNYLHGGRYAGVCVGPPTAVQSQILEYLEDRVHVFLKHEFCVEEFHWPRFLQTRTLSYGGEEVRTAQWTTWANLKPALPYGAIGKIPAIELAEGGVLDALQHPDRYLRPGWNDHEVRSSRVMVDEHEWPELARGLVEYNLVSIIPESAVAKAGGRMIQNGLFGIEKGEVHDGVEVHRLIMNLVPFNSVCLSVEGDVGTLPLMHQMNALQLHPHEEMVISSEDVRCFFYVFSLPPSWLPYLTFSRPVPSDLVPPGVTERCYLSAKVLPMGFLNSVGIAQHLHRNFLRKVQGSPSRLLGFSELRKDRAFTLANPTWRVYLDNLDVLEKVSPAAIPLLEGQVSAEVSPLIAAYQASGIPLNPKKSVHQKQMAEMQGADLDGSVGMGRPKGDKLAKYVSAALSLLKKGSCTQKAIRIVAGGFVYFGMFRRALMSSLNYIWQFIQSFDESKIGFQQIPGAVKSELLMFISLLPLAHFDFRSSVSGLVTASDASMLGGGVCASEAVSTYGATVASLPFRGESSLDIPEKGIVCVGLFDGISGLRVALEAVRAQVCLHISVESDVHARRVVETAFPKVHFLDEVEQITPQKCREWAGRATNARLVLVGAGPPRGPLHKLVLPVVEMLKEAFPWAAVHFLQESVFSMSPDDRSALTLQAGVLPYMIPASGISPCRRDRLYWFDWGLTGSDQVRLYPPSNSHSSSYGEVHFHVELDAKGVLEPGWQFHHSTDKFHTFTSAQSSDQPRVKPAGLERCNSEELARWTADRHRFPPYQYQDRNLLWHTKHPPRPASASERERAMGYPVGYTLNSMPKGEAKQNKTVHDNIRLSLLGNSWNVAVIGFLLIHVLAPLELCLVRTLDALLATLYRDLPLQGDCLLSWHSLGRVYRSDSPCAEALAQKLMTLMSAKGEDVMLQISADARVQQKYRNSIPAGLWVWQEICGWKWPDAPHDHINKLELRALYTSLRWRVLRRHETRIRCLHLTDSMVCLHLLRRGRSSSRKLQSLLYRVSSLLLATGLHPFVAYVSTDTNPADRPSRRARVRKKWLK